LLYLGQLSAQPPRTIAPFRSVPHRRGECCGITEALDKSVRGGVDVAIAGHG
jgi:hypothetical protein